VDFVTIKWRAHLSFLKFSVLKSVDARDVVEYVHWKDALEPFTVAWGAKSVLQLDLLLHWIGFLELADVAVVSFKIKVFMCISFLLIIKILNWPTATNQDNCNYLNSPSGFLWFKTWKKKYGPNFFALFSGMCKSCSRLSWLVCDCSLWRSSSGVRFVSSGSKPAPAVVMVSSISVLPPAN